MTSVAKLKDKARDYERKEDWAKAVDAYLQVIQATEKGDGEAELSLYNRVGDLYLRLGKPSDAVDYYSKAADHYGEAGLYNNAIALCNKALRYQPDRLELYRKLGKLSAEQGFTTDARRWYLEYAEKLAKQGKKDDAFAALKEFADLSEDPEIREMLAAQLQARGETVEAVNQLRMAWTQYSASGAVAKSDELRKRILGLDPSLEGTDLTLTVGGAAGARGNELPGMYMDKAAPAAAEAAAPGETIGVDEGYGFGVDGAPQPAGTEAAPLPGLDEAPDAADVEPTALAGLEATDMGAGADEGTALPTIDVDQGASLIEEAPEEVADLPGFGDVGLEPTVDASDAGALPGFDDIGLETGEFQPPAEEEVEAGGFDLPMLEGELAPADALETGALPTFDEPAEEPAAADWDDAGDMGDALPTFDDVEPMAAELPVLEDITLSDVAAAEPVVAAEPASGAADIDEWGDFPGDQQDVASLAEAGASLDDASITADLAAAFDAPLGGAPVLEEPIVEEPVAEEPIAEEPIPEEPVEPEPEPESVPIAAAPIAVAAAVDVDELIRSARTRFDAGERREALASLEAQHANLADANRVADAYRVAEALVALDPDAVPSHQARVEYAFRLDDRSRLVAAYLDFAACLRRSGAEAKAESVFNRVLEIDPTNTAARAAVAKPVAPAAPAASAPSDDFVDLGGLLRDDEEETTRFVVAETVESGDEERDFADMLSQFRAKIAQHVPQEDTDSHYDLGIAFKEMGLIDEAISEFQIALRGGKENLKVYEELGSCFMQKEQYNIAAKLLARGAQLPAKDDSELLGVYYLLGRCYEELGQNHEAKEAYERVLGLDIDFRDVNERLARL